jgi:hypothetical protein
MAAKQQFDTRLRYLKMTLYLSQTSTSHIYDVLKTKIVVENFYFHFQEILILLIVLPFKNTLMNFRYEEGAISRYRESVCNTA